MALDIDAFAVLRSICAHPDTFSDIAAEAAKAARALVVKQIKAKSMALKSIQGIRSVIGAGAFTLILDGMSDSQIKTLVKKLDKNHPDLNTASSRWFREHALELVAGSIYPASKPQAAPRRARSPRASSEQSTPELISYRSAGAKRKR